MHDKVPTFLPRLDAQRAGGLGPDVYAPDYTGLSIANLPASLCAWLGVNAPEAAAPRLVTELQDFWKRTFKNVILFVMDGFGLDHCLRTLEESQYNPDLRVWRDLSRDSLLAPLTSVVPSTTTAALTTLWTGALPAEHGVVGYELFLKEYGLIANMIFHNPASYSDGPGSLLSAGFDARAFLPVETLGTHLARLGVKPHAFIHRSLARSSLSTQLHRDANDMPFLNLADLFVNLDALLDAQSFEKRYIYVYWPGLDDTQHHFGPQDERVQRELAAFSQQLAYFLNDRRKRGRDDTLLLMTADHGHISTPKNPAYELRNHPGLLEHLVMMPSGEGRLPYVYVRPGRDAAFREYVANTWGEAFKVVAAEKFLASGLFGGRSIYRRLPERLGDYVVIPQTGAYWYFADKENRLLGRHGGLSRAEMLVPLLGTVL